MTTTTTQFIDGTTDWFICSCGNQPDADGFFSCLADGTIVSPTLNGEWDGTFYICESCQRIINGATLAVVGSARRSVAYRNAKFDWTTY